MTVLAAHGVAIDLPAGWDGRIRRRSTVEVAQRNAASGPPSAPPVIAQAATFSLPPQVGDFGGGAVERMRAADLFLSIVEYDADSVGTVLFRRVGVPRRLRVDSFHPQALQRTLPGQGGVQVFFTEAGRAFCLYVVLGSYLRRGRTVPVVNRLLGGIQIERAGQVMMTTMSPAPTD